MESLTVFDPEKVFTEVIYSYHTTSSCGWNYNQLVATILLSDSGPFCKHIKFFFNKDSLCTYLERPGLYAPG